jgi:hypothetical protein
MRCERICQIILIGIKLLSFVLLSNIFTHLVVAYRCAIRQIRLTKNLNYYYFSILDKIQDYKRRRMQYVNRMPRNNYSD